jgi:ClpP class serine protease
MVDLKERAALRQVIEQVTSIDAVVALEVSAMLHGLECIEARSAQLAAVAHTVAQQPGKIALIGVYGGLTPRGSYYGSSLAGIAASASRAAADPDVAGIIIDVDSPGGTVSGTAEAAAAVADAASKKPVSLASIRWPHRRRTGSPRRRPRW